MKKVIYLINFVYGFIYGSIIAKILIFLRMMSKRSLLFKNVTLLDGRPFDKKCLIEEFIIKQKALTLVTEKGKRIALVHGFGNKFAIEGKIVDYEEMAAHYRKGNYILISCGNAYHNNYFTLDRAFFVEPNTSTRYQIQTIVKDNLLWFASDMSVDIEDCILNQRWDLGLRMIIEKKSLAEVLGIV